CDGRSGSWARGAPTGCARRARPCCRESPDPGRPWSGRVCVSSCAHVTRPWGNLGTQDREHSHLIGREVAVLRRRFSFFALLLVSLCALAQAPYYPDAVWQRKTPAEAGVNAQRLKDAID